VSETEGQEPKKKPGFFSRIFGGGDDSDQHKSLTKMDSLAAYVIREHRSGRPLEEILEDPYLKNRATDEQRLRLLDRPDVIRAVGEDVANMTAEHVRES
jgi:hypothetical protein